MTIDRKTEEELREIAKDRPSWADYRLFSSTIDTALRHYRNKLVTILNDDEITKTNELVKKDLFENLRVIQNVLEVLNPTNQEMLDRPKGKVFEYKSLILIALSSYEDDIKHSKELAAKKLNSSVFTTVDKEINAISQTKVYIQGLA